MKHSVVMPIKIEHEWQRAMTECAIKTLYATAKTPFQMVVVECGTDYFKSPPVSLPQDKFCAVWADGPEIPSPYLHFKIGRPTSPNDELNRGIDAAAGEYIVYTQNDIFVRPGWLEALEKPFEEIKDCGVSTLASADLNGKLPFQMPCDLVMEGVYGPFMMFRKGWKIDAENFPCSFGDTDLIMRIYESGLRSYRNFSVVIQHLNKATTAGPENDEDFKLARQRFAAKHRGSPLLMYHALVGGQIL